MLAALSAWCNILASGQILEKFSEQFIRCTLKNVFIQSCALFPKIVVSNFTCGLIYQVNILHMVHFNLSCSSNLSFGLKCGLRFLIFNCCLELRTTWSGLQVHTPESIIDVHTGGGGGEVEVWTDGQIEIDTQAVFPSCLPLQLYISELPESSVFRFHLRKHWCVKQILLIG